MRMMNFKSLLNGMLKVSRLLNLAKTREEAPLDHSEIY